MLDRTNAHKSVYDDDSLYWLEKDPNTDNTYLILAATVHVDDILLAGALVHINRLQAKLESRLGELKRQELPFTHTGLEHEMVTSSCLLQHQQTFIQTRTHKGDP